MSKKKPKPAKAVVPATPNPVGRPSSYDPRFCQMLIEHSRQGGSLESFGAVAKCSIQTLYNWLTAHPEFLEARKEGEALLHQFYEDLGKMIVTGQLRRVKSERPMMIKDREGNLVPARDPVTNQVLMEREYEPATAGQSSWIFMCKNLLGWRDKRDINVAGQPDNPTPVQVQSQPAMSKAEVQKRYDELVRKALEDQGGSSEG